jgi:hypothetical protein
VRSRIVEAAELAAERMGRRTMSMRAVVNFCVNWGLEEKDTPRADQRQKRPSGRRREIGTVRGAAGWRERRRGMVMVRRAQTRKTSADGVKTLRSGGVGM